MKTLLVLSLTLSWPLSLRAAEKPFTAEKKDDRVVITRTGKPLMDFVFKDPQILRPYLVNLKDSDGTPLTRPHPPAPEADHATMHPGIWLAFGDVCGQDFWRNKAAIRHERFDQEPSVSQDSLTFSTLSKMVPVDGPPLAEMKTTITVSNHRHLMLLWDAAITPLVDGFYFGDQEEMGFGIRLAPALTEKNGAEFTASTGKKTAKETWGQIAKWCDCEAKVGENWHGLTLIPSEENFRPSWFHNRDYGLMVANPFGRKAFTQSPAPDRVPVEKGRTFRLRFGVALHGDFELGILQGGPEMELQYHALARRDEVLASARQVISSLRKAGSTAAAGALDHWSIGLNTYTDCLSSRTIASLYSDTCRKLKELYGNDAKTVLWKDIEGYPRLETFIDLKDYEGKVHSHLIVRAYNNNDNDSYHFAIARGAFEGGEDRKLQPSWELPKGHLRADAE